MDSIPQHYRGFAIEHHVLIGSAVFRRTEGPVHLCEVPGVGISVATSAIDALEGAQTLIDKKLALRGMEARQ